MTPDSDALSPEQVTRAFETKRKGYDPAAVDAHLKIAASTVTGLESEVVALAAKLDAMNAELAAAREAAATATTNPIELDEELLADRIGQDAARVLSEARAAAADRVREAEEEAEAILAKAEAVFAARSVEADEQAARIRARAEADAHEKAEGAKVTASEIVLAAEADIELARSEVSTSREHADEEAAHIIREAELARRQILEDLARRRSAARRQIEQLRAGRERLLSSHETVRRALDEISEELTISMSEARAAAETAGHTVSDTTIEELEAEIETARLTGLLDTGPVPVVRSPALPTSSSANTSSTRTGSSPKASQLSSVKTPTSSSEEKVAEPAVDADGDGAVDGVIEPDDAGADQESAGTEAAVLDEVDETVSAGDEDAGSGDEDSGDEDSGDEDSGDEDSGDETAGLAQVVQLDKARSEVDTASHPATGRDAGNGRSNSSASAPKSDATADTTTVDLRSTDSATAEPDDSVGSLFASLRSESDSTTGKSAKSATKKPVTKKKSATKKSGTKNSTGTTAKKSTAAKKSKSAPAPAPASLIDSSVLARRLKRVLADEQSRAMSTLKNVEDLPDLDGLLGSTSDHREPYWNEVLDQVDNPAAAGPDASDAIDTLIDTIRRRVGEALASADGDGEAAVASLRSIYREIKTQQVGKAADLVGGGILATS